MSHTQRKEIIKKIEALRGSKVITYAVSTRDNINTMIDPRDIRIILDHLKEHDKIDLFIYSNGGVSSTAWPLVNLIRGYTKEFSVLIPYNAFSCATSISLGADNIIMGKMGILGPVDPTVSNDFNPRINNQVIGISVEDVAGFLDLIREKFKIRGQKYISKHFEQLTGDIRPLALGNAYRHYVKAREDAKKMLSLHMDCRKDKKKIKKIIEILVTKLHFHGHNINRAEAKEIGLNVINADTIVKEENNLENLIWELYKDYEIDLELGTPYKDSLPQGTEEIIKIPIKFVESTEKSNNFVIIQKFVKLNFPAGSQLLNNNGQMVVQNGTSGQILPVVFMGAPTVINGEIYDKQESIKWE
jgi:hypothetical protein